MNIEPYLERIRYAPPVRPDLETLQGLVQAHLQHVPFENLDQHLAVPVSNQLDDMYQKIVARRRGGWCFELNGLFAWLLGEIGFKVTRLAGRVGANQPAPPQTADHMLLLVECAGFQMVDVGFGGGQAKPIALSTADHKQSPYSISLCKNPDDTYYYREQVGNHGSGFRFDLEPRNLSDFDAMSSQLQTEPDSAFLRTLTAQRRYPDRHILLRGLVMRTFTAHGIKERTLETPRAFERCLARDFDLHVPEISSCWPQLRERHKTLFGRSRLNK